MRFNTLQAWLDWQESLNPAEIDLGLERVAKLVDALDLHKVASCVITFAGTNGKGSTIAATESILQKAGITSACYTSPHLIRYNERCRVNGKLCSDDDFCRAFAAIDDARGDIPLTYFEFGTLAALWLIKRSEVDVALLEVGLGGRLDAVNAVDADLAVITQVDIDHKDWLGDNREIIGGEKAGIFRAHQQAVIADPHPPESVKEKATALGVKALYRGVDFDLQQIVDTGTWIWSGIDHTDQKRNWLDFPEVAIPQDSAVCAVQIALTLKGLLPVHLTQGLEEENILAALAETQLAGRFQRKVLNDVEIIFDVAHNPAACELLAKRLNEKPVSGKTIAMFSAMQDKDLPEMIAPLATNFEAWFLSELSETPRAMAPRDISNTLFESGIGMISVSKNIAQAHARVMSILSEGDRLVVFGSFFIVGPVLERVERLMAKSNKQPKPKPKPKPDQGETGNP